MTAQTRLRGAALDPAAISLIYNEKAWFMQKKAPNRCVWLGARKRVMRGAPGGKPARAATSTARRGALPMMNDVPATSTKIGWLGRNSIVGGQKN